MRSPTALYPLVEAWLDALVVVRHRTRRQALAALLTALLVAQSLRPASLMRALPSPTPIPARQRYKRLARALDRPGLTSAQLTPALVRAACALIPAAGPSHLVLDTVRCGGWEVMVLGLVACKRIQPLAWAVLPYPVPKGRFTPTACALVQQVAALWPAGRPVHLVADRGFPSQALFRTLAAVGWSSTVRLPARSALTVGGVKRIAREVLATVPHGRWQAFPVASYGQSARAPRGTLVVGRPLVVLPAHQATPGSLRARHRRAAQRTAQLAHKHRRPDGSAQTDGWVILFTTHATAVAAQASYRQRWAIEPSLRDAQGGWDGQHGWDLEPTVAGQTKAQRVETACGLWALGILLQHEVGRATLAADVPAAITAEVAGWTTTGRLSIWARGRFALHEPSGRLADWVAGVLRAGAARVAAAPPLRPRLIALPGGRAAASATVPPAPTAPKAA